MLKQRNIEGRTEIFDPIRKKWVSFTEEEKVRQLFILFMIQEKKIPATHISIEKKIIVNGLEKRYDIVVYNRKGQVALVVECKAPSVPITQAVLEQVGNYNKELLAPTIGVTNGKVHYFFAINFETSHIQLLNDFPSIN